MSAQPSKGNDKSNADDAHKDDVHKDDVHKDDVHKIVLDIDPAKEVVALLADEPGVADEELLDEALEAIDQAGDRIPSDAQKLAAAGEAVAIELDGEATTAVEQLIRDDKVTRPRLLARVRDRLRGKLERARNKRRG